MSGKASIDEGICLTALPVDLKERVEVDAFWFHGDGEGWSFHSQLTIDSTIIYLDNFNYAVTDIVELIKEEMPRLSNPSIKSIAQFAYTLTKESFTKKPSKSVHEAYYGL